MSSFAGLVRLDNRCQSKELANQLYILYCIVWYGIGGLKSMGLTKPHVVGTEMVPPVGTLTIYDPWTMNQLYVYT